jgi:hypothetical protein
MMLIKQQKQTCAISMGELGIATVVLTSKEDIEATMHEFTVSPDYVWCNGRGKRYLYKSLKEELQGLDKHFNSNPAYVTAMNQKWTDFCDDCVVLYVLDALLFNKPFLLIHPESYVANIHNAVINATSGGVPDLIPGIPVQQ